ncbi:MAG: RNA-binding transcriptional accessory protein, partial [Pseudomonadota bacterium]|nr:RNA-binding transcriptional accessory protein [Pseudomonadota bacterium]
MLSIGQRIANELNVQEWQVKAAIELLDGGSTVPFIARYRKEATGTLDDAQLRTLDERLRYLRELEDRRKTILDSVREQGKLTDELALQLNTADTKARLEDLYLPYKPKRRTKAQIAREAGLEPLADLLLSEPHREPKQAAAAFVNAEKEVATPEAALEGARSILVERFAENAELLGALRETYWERGSLTSKVRDGKQTDGAKFADYFDFAEPLTKLPSHRILALFRGEKEEILDLRMEEDKSSAEPGYVSRYEGRTALAFGISDQGRPGDKWLLDTVRWAWRTKLRFSIELDMKMRLWQLAEDEAVKVFAGNLRDLLLAAPAGARPTLGLDPGYRTGVKVAVVDATGKVVATDTIYPHEPKRQWDESVATLARLCRVHRVELIAIGNGTASRETDKLAGELVSKHPDLTLTKIMVSEAGASVYSASAYASQELPGLDVSLRGAVSIARRLQDPLAELVKIDPKSIGVGQYQHDLAEYKLSRSLDAVVEDCVNAVGVDLNTASAPLLARVSGLGDWVAQNIVTHRDANGPFKTRKALTKVSGLGPKTFEQAAGFLRIPNGDDPLDASGVHPEAYPVVRRILEATKSDIKVVIGNGAVLKKLNPQSFTDEKFGVPTVKDILSELEKPGRDPRPEF